MNYLELLQKNNELLKEHDETWIKRRRKLDTTTVFNYLTASAINNTGISTNVNLDGNFSHTALIKARGKLGKNVFKTINDKIHTECKLSNSFFAIDGSKIRVHEGFKKNGYKVRTNDKDVPRPAKRPLAMLSALVGLDSDTIVDYQITKHFNERECVKPLIETLPTNSVVVLDRGYYSSSILNTFYQTGVSCVMRLKRTANAVVSNFYKSRKTDEIANILHEEKFLKLRLLKYSLNGHVYIMGTTLLSSSLNQIKNLYKRRWRIEVCFKRLKSHLHLNHVHARTESLWLQEVQARILHDTVCRTIQIEILRRKENEKHKRGVHTLRFIYKVVKDLFNPLLYFEKDYLLKKLQT